MKVDDLLPFLSAVAIGLLVGFERERSHRGAGTQPAGSRTFALLALAGALAAAWGSWVVAGAVVAVGGVLWLGYRRTSVDDPGATTEVAALVTFLIGALAWTDTALAAALAIVMVALLASKSRIHAFATDVITDLEVEDAIRLLVMAFVVLPLLPDHDVGPYGVLNPRRIWQLVVVLTGISWVGYVATRLVGSRRGLLVAGLAGGFISASATTASMGRHARDTGESAAALGGAFLASVATFAQLAGIVAVADRPLLTDLWPALVAGVLALAGSSYLVARRRDAAAPQVRDAHPIRRPFGLGPVLLLAGVLTGALLVGRWVVAAVGSGGSALASGAAGLADAHAGALAAASLHEQGEIGLVAALLSVGAAVSVNTLVKVAVAFTTGGRSFGWRFAAGVAPGFVVFAGAVIAAAVHAS